MKKSKIYALLIGINKYEYFDSEEGEYDLEGCVKDSLAVGDYLKETVINGKERLFIRYLHSPKPEKTEEKGINCASQTYFKASRKNILAGFQEYLTKAQPADTVLIYFSGHGLRQPIPEEMWRLDTRQDPEHKGETLMCADSFTWQGDEWVVDIKDWEIRWLIANIAGEDPEKAPHIVFISDCCHSSGNTRDFDTTSTLKVRGMEDVGLSSAPKSRSLDELIFYQKSEKIRKQLADNPSSFHLPEGRHITIAAAHHYELAKEHTFPEGRFGILTYFLLKVLRATKGNISYRDLTKLIRAKTVHEIDFQTPQYYATIPEDANQLFLGGNTLKTENYYTASLRQTAGSKQSIIMDAGSLHGIPLIAEGITEVHLFPNLKDPKTIPPNELLKGKLIDVKPHKSIVELQNGTTFPPDQLLMKAVITAMPFPKTKVLLATESKGKSNKKNKVAKGMTFLSQALQKSRFLEQVHDTPSAQYRLFAYQLEGQEKYRITKKDQINALVPPKIGFTKINAQTLIQEMEHIARWERKIKLNKKIAIPIYCALIHLSADYGIDTNFLPPDTILGQAAYTDDGKEIRFEQSEIYALHASLQGQVPPKEWYFGLKVPDKLLNRGIKTIKDHFKLIVSTQQFDARHLHQKALDIPTSDRFSPPVKGALDALLKQTHTRNNSNNSAEVADWWTTLVSIQTTCE